MATQTKPAAASAPNYTIPFITVTILFGIFGFLTSLNNQLVNKLKEIFHLSYGPSMLATTAWFFAYLVFSVPSGKLIERVGYKRTMVISLFIMVIGALLFVPATNASFVNHMMSLTFHHAVLMTFSLSFLMTLIAIFVLASGVTALQTSANPYVAILGPEHSASARLNLAQAFNSGASAVAGWFTARFILADTSKVSDAASQAHMLQMPYVYIAVGLLVLGFAVMRMNLPTISMARPSEDTSLSGRSIWRYSHTVLGMIGIFFYVGVEIALAAIAIQYFQQQGISSLEIAGFLVTVYYLFIMAGRFLGSFLMKWFKAEKMLFGLGLLGVALMLVSMFTHGQVAIWSLVLCGLANSIMYPTIFTLGIAELGPMTSKGSGVITIGNVGGAVIPPLLGFLADKVGIQYAFVLPIIGYIFITYYGFSGYKPTRAVKA
jgi:FHS family L-fucose permease-like MFS transporter